MTLPTLTPKVRLNMSFSGDMSKGHSTPITADKCPYCNGDLEDGMIFDESSEYIGIRVKCTKCNKELIRWQRIVFDHLEDEENQDCFYPDGRQLTAAAPDLLACCDAVLSAWHNKASDYYQKEPAYLEAIRIAINKATLNPESEA